MKQDIKTFSLRKLVVYRICGVKTKGTRDQRWYNFFNSPIFSNVKCTYYKSAKYRTIKKIVPSLIPCSLPFYTTIAFKSYIPLTFSERMFFILCKMNANMLPNVRMPTCSLNIPLNDQHAEQWVTSDPKT